MAQYRHHNMVRAAGFSDDEVARHLATLAQAYEQRPVTLVRLIYALRDRKIRFVLTTLAVLTCLACTVLLFRGYARSGLRLLLWSALCFVFLTLNNLLLFFDLQVFIELDLRPYRLPARSRSATSSPRRFSCASGAAPPIACS